MIDGESHSNYSECSIRWKIGHHTSTNGGFASPEAGVNVAVSLEIGERMTTEFRASLPNGFHSTISSSIKVMEHTKKGVKVGDTTIFDLEAIFLRLSTIGQQRQLELAPIFQYELCPFTHRRVWQFEKR